MKKSTKLLAWAVAVAIGGLAMTNIASAYTVTYHPEANVSYTLNSGFDTKRDFTGGLITITDWDETYTIMDRNLWATSTGVDSSDSYWYYFQWWNNYWFPTAWSVATSSKKVDASGYGPWHYYSSSTFITSSLSPWDRSSVQNRNLRWWVSGTYEAMQWPCPEWYHVPSSGEWFGLLTMLWFDGTYNSNVARQARDRLNTELYFPFAGYRSNSSAGVGNQGTDARYWASNMSSVGAAYNLGFDSDTLNPKSGSYPSYGSSVRCFKNSPYSASDLPSEGGDSEIVVNIAALNGGQNTCSGEDFIFPAITASPVVQTIKLAKKFQCIFWNAANKAVTLHLSGDLTDWNGNVIPWANVKLSNPEWTSTPTWLKNGTTAFSGQTFMWQWKTLFNKVENMIWEAQGSGVQIEITVPAWTPDGTYQWTIILDF